MDLLMGIDLGSTSLKAVVYDLGGKVVASGSRPTQKCHPSTEHPEWTVWDPKHIGGDTAAAIREAVGKLAEPRAIRAVAVTGMGMDGLPVDAAGNELYPMISWHDPRTGPQYEWWLRNIGAEKVFSIGGNPLWPINSALRILWMMEHEPQLIARADKWLLIEDYVNFLLCGRMVTDYSMASCTLLFDQRSLSWSDELIGLTGIDRRLLCEARPSGTIIGEVDDAAAEATGLPRGTPVVLGGHDHICGALPVGAFRPGVVLNVLGTWETVLTSTAGPVLKDELRQAGMTVQAHVARGRHTIWGGNVAGEMLEWYRRQFGEAATTWDVLLAEAAAAAPGAGGVMFLPHMSSAACPIVDPKSLGAFVGLATRTSRGEMLRAIIEGLNYQSLAIVTAMEKSLGTQQEKFVAVGGATRNALWLQSKADIVGRPVEVPAVEEASPLGAAILAGIGVGLYADEDDALARVYQPGKTYTPDANNTARYARLADVYRQLYPATKPLHHALFEEFAA